MVVIKHTSTVVENGVSRQKFTCEPLFAAFVRSKHKEVYISFWRRLIDLYGRFYPNEDPLILGNISNFLTFVDFYLARISMDFERGMASGIRAVWPEISIKFCSFHLCRAAQRKLLKVYNVGRPSSSSITREISILVNALPYISWTEELKKVFFSHIRKKSAI